MIMQTIYILSNTATIDLMRNNDEFLVDNYKLVFFTVIGEEEEKIINSSSENRILITHGVSQILSEKQLKLFSMSINIHSASPDFPGRDPHHYASYNNSSTYGAVAHFMTPKVDSGGIIDAEIIDSKECDSSWEYLKIGDQCSLTLMSRVLKKIDNNDNISENGMHWGPKKTKRSDLIEYSRISLFNTKEEVRRKYKSFQENIDHKNLYIDIHGLRFRFEKEI